MACRHYPVKFRLTDSSLFSGVLPMPSASGPPALFNVSGTSSSSISVFWEEPRAPNGKIDFYQLQFGGESVQVENATEFTLTGLAKNSKYIISLKVILSDDVNRDPGPKTGVAPQWYCPPTVSRPSRSYDVL